MAAARELRYHSRSAVYGDLAYDLDREVREHALRHAGEAPRRQPEAAKAPARAKPRVRSLSKEQVRQRQKVSVLSVLGVGAAIGLAVLVLMGYIQLTAISSQVVDLQEELEALMTELSVCWPTARAWSVSYWLICRSYSFMNRTVKVATPSRTMTSMVLPRIT